MKMYQKIKFDLDVPAGAVCYQATCWLHNNWARPTQRIHSGTLLTVLHRYIAESWSTDAEQRIKISNLKEYNSLYRNVAIIIKLAAEYEFTLCEYNLADLLLWERFKSFFQDKVHIYIPLKYIYAAILKLFEKWAELHVRPNWIWYEAYSHEMNCHIYWCSLCSYFSKTFIYTDAIWRREYYSTPIKNSSCPKQKLPNCSLHYPMWLNHHVRLISTRLESSTQ